MNYTWSFLFASFLRSLDLLRNKFLFKCNYFVCFSFINWNSTRDGQFSGMYGSLELNDFNTYSEGNAFMSYVSNAMYNGSFACLFIFFLLYWKSNASFMQSLSRELNSDTHVLLLYVPIIWNFGQPFLATMLNQQTSVSLVWLCSVEKTCKS